jgi:hypothetical protein
MLFLRNLFVSMIVLTALAGVADASPVASPGTTVCGTSWFYGYQSPGLIYTMGDADNDGAFVIGGTVSSGCSVLSPGQTFLNDQCVVIEYFATQTAVAPTASYILGEFAHSSGANLGIVGLLALKKSKLSNYSGDISGVVQIGAGTSYTSNAPWYTPDGTELAIFEVTAGVV